MVFSNHQLSSAVRWCSGPPAKLRPAMSIVEPVFPAKVSFNNSLSPSQGFLLTFCSLLGSSSHWISVQSSWNFLIYSRQVSIRVVWGLPSLFEKSAATVSLNVCLVSANVSTCWVNPTILTPCRPGQMRQAVMITQWTQSLFHNLLQGTRLEPEQQQQAPYVGPKYKWWHNNMTYPWKQYRGCREGGAVLFSPTPSPPPPPKKNTLSKIPCGPCNGSWHNHNTK